ncbi:MAG: hypothetical protein KA764_18970 [Anaerolineales bacterium]|nr:hypothetical protein [Anaerolineales bacterium]
MTTDDAAEKPNPLETFVAILIALITVAGALVAWRASIAADSAGDADNGGLRAMLNVEETRAANAVNGYEAYGAFVNYARYQRLGDYLEADPAAADLEIERANARDLALANQFLFDNKFLNRDGTYDLQRQLGELWSDASREKDLNPEPQFQEADKLRDRSNYLLADVALLAFGLVLLTLVEAASDRLQYVLTGLGATILVAGIALAVWIEMSL